MMKKRAVVTGATGFIGSHLIRRLSPSYDLFCTAEKIPEHSGSEGVTWIEHDFSSPFDRALFPARVDHIIHLTQFPGHRLFPEKALTLFQVNTESTLALLDYGRQAGISSFVFASSGNVYGPRYSPEPLMEEGPCAPADFYGHTKYASEQLLPFYREFFPSVAFRIFFCYGEGQQGRLIPGIVERVKEGREVTVVGSEGMSFTPVHVNDAVHCMEKALSLKESATLNLAGNEVTTLKGLALLAGSLCGREPLFAFRTGESQPCYVASIEKLKKTLDYVPSMPLAEGVAPLCTPSE
ncbi:MAG: NAD(P)-dependent oxidoreductase [Candidatus Eremiobacteraeota bacterium]|nr:NAD(P)-dependent oxidoreductase [Candidatus Eremiobacteraeota bacterium]